MKFREFWAWLPKKLDYKKYEKEIEDDLKEVKHLWIKKCAGLGITEFMLRWIAWNCLKDDEWKNKQIDVNVVLITGPRIDLAITIIRRLKDLFQMDFKTKETVCILNGNRIEAFPSHHVASAHGLNPQVVLMEEGDLFPPGQQQESREVAERYLAKTNPYIIWVSTPYLPGGLYEQIEKEPEEACLYRKRIYLYDIGLRDGRFTQKEIDSWMLSPSFEREANGKYGYGIGNIFQGLDDVITEYDLISIPSEVCLLDPAYGSSNFGIMGMGRKDGVIYIKEAQELQRPSLSFATEKTYEIAKNYGITLIDSSEPGIIRELQDKGINCMPVNFAQQDDNKQTLKSKMIAEAAVAVREKRVRIHKIFRELQSQLRAVRFDKRGGPDKSELNYDLGDCFSMGINHLKETRIISKIVSQEYDEDE